MREELGKLALGAVENKTFPGCVIGIVRSGGEHMVLPFGRHTYEESSFEVREDTIYDLASVTKSIPVASLAAMFVAQGKLRLDDTIVSYIPELQSDHGATIEDLLRYRVRGPRMSTLGFPTFEQIRTHMLESGFDGPPGESEYANGPAFILGIVLERVGGMQMPALAHKYFFGPLGMKDTTFFPYDLERIAPTEVVNDKKVHGIVHDESARLFAQRRRVAGHAGLFSTAPDLLKFIEAIFDDRFAPVLDAATQGLGWQLLQDGRFGKSGFTGTFVVVDPRKKLGFVLLSNRTYPVRSDIGAIRTFRERAAEMVFSS